MIKKIEDKLLNVPILSSLVKLGKKVKIPGLRGMSLYDLLEMYVIGIVNGAFTSRAGGIAFSFFMAIFPFLLFILTLIPFVTIENFQMDFMKLIYQVLPPNTSDSVDMVILDIANNPYGGLLSFGFFASIFLMTNGVNAIFGGFEYSYHVKETRSIIRQYFIAMGVSLLLSILLLLTVAIMIYLEVGMNNLEEEGWLGDVPFWVEIGRTLFFIIMIYTSVSILYNFGVKKKSQRLYYSPGAVLTTLLTLLMFYIFGIYVVKFSQYNELYGSIGTLLVFMLFIWLNSIILLLGFELNAAIDRLKIK